MIPIAGDTITKLLSLSVEDDINSKTLEDTEYEPDTDKIEVNDYDFRNI
jgi:hypothetical protein